MHQNFTRLFESRGFSQAADGRWQREQPLLPFLIEQKQQRREEVGRKPFAAVRGIVARVRSGFRRLIGNKSEDA